jgi:hypothetical protein
VDVTRLSHEWFSIGLEPCVQTLRRFSGSKCVWVCTGEHRDVPLADGAPPRRSRLLHCRGFGEIFYGLAHASYPAFPSVAVTWLRRCLADRLRDCWSRVLSQGRQAPLLRPHFRVCVGQGNSHHARAGRALHPLRYEDATPPACLHAVRRRSPAATHGNYGTSATADVRTPVGSSTASPGSFAPPTKPSLLRFACMASVSRALRGKAGAARLDHGLKLHQLHTGSIRIIEVGLPLAILPHLRTIVPRTVADPIVAIQCCH